MASQGDSGPSLAKKVRAGVRLVMDEHAMDRGILVAFAGREGGVSEAPYESLNLGYLTGDDRGAVAENRKRVARAARFDEERMTLARQVHGTDVLEAGPADAGVLGEADGLIARSPGPVLGILSADCAPVALAGTRGVAILHGGWRGLVAGVIERGVERLGGASEAWIGPCIRACCYEVGPEVVAAFEEAGLPVASPGRVDPAIAACRALERSGVEAVHDSGICTACSSRYYSYRRDGVTGRQGSFIALLP